MSAQDDHLFRPDFFTEPDERSPGSTHDPVEPLTAVPSSPRKTQREETRRRTAELMDQFGSSTPAVRLLIRDEVVTLHLWMATSAARRYGFRGEQDDLVQVARGGLVEAFDRFELGQTTYAYFAWITMNGLLRRHLRDHGWSVRPPRAVQEAANVLRRLVPELTQELGRAPRAADLAEHLGWSLSEVYEARAAELGLYSASLDALSGDSSAVEVETGWNQVEARMILHEAATELTAGERELLRLRFGVELTQSQIGLQLGVTQMQVSRMLSRLMIKMRTAIGELDDQPA